MSSLPSQANVVVIGAGIVGNSLVYHLARQGWTDIVQLDKGPLPNPGGSTGHASNFIYPVDHSKEMTHITRDSIRQYEELGVFKRTGGFEVARTEARVEELKRRVSSALAWGERGELMTPAQVKEKVPYINPEVIRAGFWCPDVGVVDSIQAGVLMRQYGIDRGVLSVFPNTEITGLQVVNGRIRAVHTDRGTVRAETVIIACGVWSPYIARMAGATIPLHPMVHQMIDVGPIPLFQETGSEIAFPIVRDVDENMYERQNGADLEVGSYAHRPIFVDPEEIPSLKEATLSPTELPFTQEDFDHQMEAALELMPEVLEAPGAGVRHAINGLLSLTPDGAPLIGETLEVKGLWSCAAIWIKEAPGFARALVEIMTHGASEIDIHGADIARLADHARTKRHILLRCSELYNKTYGIVHPAEQYATSRHIRQSPFIQRERALGAVFFEAAGWERPQWYTANAPLLEEYAGRLMLRPNEWDARWWSPLIHAEHLALRERAGLVDLTAFAIFDFTGPGVVDFLESMVVNKVDVPVGRVVYTPLLTPTGGFQSDLTLVRMGPEHYRVITGGAMGGRDRQWFLRHMPTDGSVRFQEMTSALATLGLWGPKAREILQAVTREDVSNQAFPFGTARLLEIGDLRAHAVRISYVGELGWEIYTPIEQGERLWDLLWEAGRPHGLVPVGIGVYGTTARLEKGYRAFGDELDGEYNPVEAGLARPRVKSHDFIGKEAYLKAREEEPAAILCTLTMDEVPDPIVDRYPMLGIHQPPFPASVQQRVRYVVGHCPVLTPNGRPIEDRKGRRSYVTSAGSGPSIGKHILLAYLPPEYAQEGQSLRVQYFGRLHPVTVAAVGNRPLFDPTNERMKG